jgi:hypothetical protein
MPDRIHQSAFPQFMHAVCKRANAWKHQAFGVLDFSRVV